MVGADRTAFLHGSFAGISNICPMNGAVAPQDDCQFARANDFAVGADAFGRSTPHSAVRCIVSHSWPDHVTRQTVVVLRPLVIGIFRFDRVDSHVTLCFDCSRVCGSFRGGNLHGISAHCLWEGSLCSDRFVDR